MVSRYGFGSAQPIAVNSSDGVADVIKISNLARRYMRAVSAVALMRASLYDDPKLDQVWAHRAASPIA